jgi:hypothetical protein
MSSPGEWSSEESSISVKEVERQDRRHWSERDVIGGEES